LKNWDGLEQEVAQLRDRRRGLSGRIVLGGIPSALPMIPFLTKELNARHPYVEFCVMSLSSDEIVRSLNEGSIAAGITYLDNEPITDAIKTPLYEERYCLFVGENHPLASHETVSWCEAASKPLCLLTASMQNRRIIDDAFRRAKCRAIVRIETNSIINLCSNVRVLGIASIMPDYVIDVLGPDSGIRAIPLVEPKVTHQVGLIIKNSDLVSPLITALQETAAAVGKAQPAGFKVW
jgi:DNA-binding transcriptional LysR family regulator